MSQEKVDRYKAEKANRKKNMKKEKVKQGIRRLVVGVCGLALVGWLGYSAWDMYESSRPKQVAEVDYTAVSEYQAGLQSVAE